MTEEKLDWRDIVVFGVIYGGLLFMMYLLVP